MTALTDAQIDYLKGRRLGRLATVDEDGMPHVVPIGMYQYNERDGSLDVTGRDFARTHKFHNVQRHPKAAFVVDDLASVDPWRPRALLVQGHAEALEEKEGGSVIRIHPDHVVSWGLE